MSEHLSFLSLSSSQEVQSLTGRVLRKYAYSKALLFLDLVYCLPAHIPGDDSHYEFGTVVVEKEESHPLAVVVGDVIEVLGGRMQNAEKYLAMRERASIIARGSQLRVISAWQVKEQGVFMFEAQHLCGENEDKKSIFASDAVLRRCRPALCLQVAHKAVDRAVATLHSTLITFFPKLQFSLQVSCTNPTKSQERLIGIRLQPSAEDEADIESRIVHKLVEDPVLRSTIIRAYPTWVRNAVSVSCNVVVGALMEGLISSAYSSADSSTITGIRIQVNPKTLAAEITTKEYAGRQLPWKMHGYSHVLSVCLFDGIWMGCLVRAEDTFIGDTRERKKLVANNNTLAADSNGEDSTDAALISICRAQAKLEEIMRRNQWISDNAVAGDSALHHYRFAIDIGSSPGGWTNFLAQRCHVDYIVSVDKGELLIPQPWAANIDYWCMHGQDAVERLLQDEDLSKRVDFLCCDANIHPLMSVGFLTRLLENDRIADQARVAITLKNIFSRKDKFEEVVQESVKTLQQNGFEDIRLVHLLANTAKETTLTAVYCKKM